MRRTEILIIIGAVESERAGGFVGGSGMDDNICLCLPTAVSPQPNAAEQVSAL